jgi:hypothetical protein
MARIKANSAEDYESTIIRLSKDRYPIAYQAKLEELVEQNCYGSIEEAESDNPYFDIEVEMYYDKHHGLFAVESEAIESNAESICSPYTREYMEDSDEE